LVIRIRHALLLHLIKEIMMDNFKLYSQYYDLLYQKKNYFQEVEYVHSLIENYFSGNAKELLDLGSGTGKHGKLFAARGYNVLGLERSTEMVAVANTNKYKNFNSIQGDITDFSLNKQFDVVTALFHVISYVNYNQDIEAVFKNVHLHLKPLGVFIFDVWYSPAVYTQKPVTRIKRLNNDLIELTRIAEPEVDHNANVVTVNYHIFIKDLNNNQIKEIKEIHPMRHFSIPEIQLYADKYSFEVLKVEEFLSSNPPADDTWGVCFVLRSNG